MKQQESQYMRLSAIPLSQPVQVLSGTSSSREVPVDYTIQANSMHFCGFRLINLDMTNLARLIVVLVTDNANMRTTPYLV